MKKLLTVGTLVIGLIFLSNTNLHAQDGSGDISIGGGLGYGTEIESIGIQGGGVYKINEQFRAAADIIYYFPDEIGGGFDYNWMEFNANGHYIFTEDDGLVAYALAGLNFARVSIDYPDNDFFDGSYSETEVGLNIGAGLEYNIDFALLYAELKYALSSADQLVISAGLRFPIN
jgi:opacity protein-like surface antigen